MQDEEQAPAPAEDLLAAGEEAVLQPEAAPAAENQDDKPKRQIKRKRGNTLETWEVALVKAMMARPELNNQDILAYFTRPTRTVNHRLIGEIRDGTKHKSVKAATSSDLVFPA